MYDVDLQMHNSKHSDFLGSYTLFCLDVILDNFIAIIIPCEHVCRCVHEYSLDMCTESCDDIDTDTQ